MDKHVSAYWVDKIKLEASEKSSLKFLNTQNYKIGEVHYLWKNAGFNLMAIKKAGFKAKLMTDTYVLQSNSISILSTQRVYCVMMTLRI